MFYLLPALYVVDPEGRPRAKHQADHDSKVVIRRLAMFERDGHAAIVPLLQQYRQITFAYTQKRVEREGGDRPLAMVRQHLEAGSTLRSAIDRIKKSPQTLQGAGEFERQAKRDIATDHDTSLTLRPENVLPFELPEPKKSHNGHTRSEIRNAILTTVRKLNKDSAPHADGLTNTMCRAVLRSPTGWVTIANHAQAIESEHLRTLNAKYAQIGTGECTLSLVSSLLHAARGRAIEKKKKPGTFRIIEISGSALAMYCGMSIELNKSAILRANGDMQLCGSPSGADILVQYNQVLANAYESTHVRWGLDLKAQYPSIEYKPMSEIILEECPELFFMQETLSHGIVTHVPIAGGKVAIVSRMRSYMQGAKGSSSGAGILTAHILKKAKPLIDAQWKKMKREGKLTGQDPSMAA